MRILFLANTPPDRNSGASGCDLALIDGLRALGQEVDALWRSDLAHHIRHHNLHNLLELPRQYASAVAKQLALRDYDVVQVNQPHAYLAARLHQQAARASVFVNRSHGWEECARAAEMSWDDRPDPRSKLRQFASNLMWLMLRRHCRMVTKYSDGIVVGSGVDRDFLVNERGVPSARVLTLTPGIDPTFLETRLLPFESARALKLIYVGQFALFKAPDAVGRIVSRVLGSNSRARMTWVCAKRHHADVLSLIETDVRPRVTMLDWMSRRALRREVDRHGIFLFPSRYEGYGMAFLEAMARGLCVVASRTGGMVETIQHGRNGFLFDVGSEAEMAETILELMAAPDRLRCISSASRTTVETLTWERAARELVEFYGRLTCVRRARLGRATAENYCDV